MNWIKENPFLTGYIALTLLLLGGASYFTLQSYSGYAELEAGYGASVQSLHQLQNRSPYPSQENLAKVRETVEAYRVKMEEFQSALKKYQPPLPAGVTPEGFQDSLRQTVTAVTEKAEAAQVELPADFYLGFDAYRNSLPSPEAAPHLLRQMEQFRLIVEKLIDTKVDILTFTRSPLAIESGPAAGEKDREGKQQVVKNFLDLEIRGDQGRIRPAFNNLLQQPQFLLIRAVEFHNSSKEGPPKGGTTTASPAGQGGDIADLFASAEGAATPTTELNVILGREIITAKFRLELVEFPTLGVVAQETANN